MELWSGGGRLPNSLQCVLFTAASWEITQPKQPASVKPAVYSGKGNLRELVRLRDGTVERVQCFSGALEKFMGEFTDPCRGGRRGLGRLGKRQKVI